MNKMGTILYGEEGQEPYVKRHASKTRCKYTVCINRKLTHEEYVDLLEKMKSGLNV